jgi:hypothetical protein
VIVVLPAPEGPTRRDHLAGLGREAHVVQHLHVVSGLDAGHRFEARQGHLVAFG